MRVVVSLTTLPTRYNKLLLTINSLINQSYKPDVIYLSHSLIAKRSGLLYEKIPPEILNNVVEVILENDYGPISKLLGALEREKDDETIIVTVDDDIIYPNNLIESLLNKSKLYPDCAIGSTGVILGQNRFTISSNSSLSASWNNITGFEVDHVNGRNVDILCGVSGILYKRYFFPSISELVQYTKDEDIFRNDDVLLSMYCNFRGINRKLFSDLPLISNDNIKDGSEISASRFKFLASFYRAVQKTEKYGLRKTYIELNYNESPMYRYFVIIFVLLLILVCVYFYFLSL